MTERADSRASRRMRLRVFPAFISGSLRLRLPLCKRCYAVSLPIPGQKALLVSLSISYCGRSALVHNFPRTPWPLPPGWCRLSTHQSRRWANRLVRCTFFSKRCTGVAILSRHGVDIVYHFCGPVGRWSPPKLFYAAFPNGDRAPAHLKGSEPNIPEPFSSKELSRLKVYFSFWTLFECLNRLIIQT